MSNATQFYVTTLLIYGAVSIIACWGLDLQFGDTGILNFAFIVFQAAGAYTAAVPDARAVDTSEPAQQLPDVRSGGVGPLSDLGIRGRARGRPAVLPDRHHRVATVAVRLPGGGHAGGLFDRNHGGDQRYRNSLDGERGLFLIPKPLIEHADSLLGYQLALRGAEAACSSR